MKKRIQEERKRLGFTQTQLAEKVGLKLNAQSKYERGENEPKASYFAKLEELGADIYYILTGKRNSNNLTNEEKFLLEKFRAAKEEQRSAVLGALLFDSNSINELMRGNSVTVGDNNSGVVAGGDIKTEEK